MLIRILCQSNYDRCIKSKIRTYADNFYINLRGLNIVEVGIQYETFIVISAGSLLVYKNKYYLQVDLDKRL